MKTENGRFNSNGAERVVVSQLVRSPGVYSGVTIDKSGVSRYDTTVMPSRGAWLEFKQDSNNILWVSVDRTRKITATMFLRALGYGTDEELTALFGSEEILLSTMAKDAIKNSEDAKIELYKRMK